ncbi:MAG: tRNA guanosine(34) transglycosylase Tgt [Halobacteriovorax sp.]|nr:tRNA guanosine(34) transglycosylase Tgt [Halobacteriovorax sp.]|tara:strand:+ start:134110 stop:135240 length:1131 start_codon:yes stop_codon:yes gene_type:complete
MSIYKLEGTSGNARAGVVSTAHGDIQTPIFMPVGTRGAIKTLDTSHIESMGAQIILGNTYHLYLRPGHELIEKVGAAAGGGGLHGFMDWDGPILTDSGGFQVFSLSGLNKVTEEGVRFQSHIDGSYHMFTPEKSMEIQKALGSDIVMVFDECPALPATKEDLRKSMELTLRWAKRCKDYELKSHQHLFGIVQGGLHFDLRTECMQRLEELDFPGLALGGLSVGEKNEEMVNFLNDFTPTMPAHKPRYLMGVGKPLDVLNGIRAGIDMFDCVLPSRNARNGQVFTFDGPMNIKNERYKEDTKPIDAELNCPYTKRYTRAYLRHLFTVGEYTAGLLMTYHNLYFFLELTRRARAAILEGKFDVFYDSFYKRYTANQID